MSSKPYVAPKFNYSQVPNDYLDWIMPTLSPSEHVVMTYMFRQTIGYHELNRHLTLEDFEHGRKRSDGTPLDAGTGLSRPTIQKALRSLTDLGLLSSQDEGDAARIRRTYWIIYPTIESGVKNFYPQTDSGVKNFYPGGQESLPRSEKDTLERNSGDLKERQMQASENSDHSPETKTAQEQTTSVVEGIRLSVQLSEQQVLPHPPIAEAPPSQKPKKPLTNHQQLVGAVANNMGLGFAPSAKEVQSLKAAHADKVTTEAVEAYFEWYAKEVPGFNFPRGKKFAEWFGKYLAVAPAPVVEGQSRYTSDSFELPELGTKGD